MCEHMHHDEKLHYHMCAQVLDLKSVIVLPGARPAERVHRKEIWESKTGFENVTVFNKQTMLWRRCMLAEEL